MNIIDAIKSGKRYKRKAYREWYSPASPASIGYSSPQYSEKDILADDWEVEEKTVTITAEQLYQAWTLAHDKTKVVVGDTYIGIRVTSRPGLYEALKKELGL